MFSMTRPFGFAGERKAVALLMLSFYMAFFGLVALVAYSNEEPQWGLCFIALVLCYGVGFFSVASGWFWGRWFAIGLGYSGVTTALWGMVSLRQLEPTLLFYGLTHGIIALFLQGEKLVAQFDAKPGWREHLGLDEEAVYRVRKTVTRVASGLPTLILFALAPRGERIDMVGHVFWGWTFVPIALLGLYAILTFRTWGILLLGTSVFGLLAAFGSASMATLQMSTTGDGGGDVHAFYAMPYQAIFSHWNLLALLSALCLTFALVPFFKPALQFLRRTSRR